GRMGLAGNQKEPSLHLRADELNSLSSSNRFPSASAACPKKPVTLPRTPPVICRFVCPRGMTLLISAQKRSGLPVYSDAPNGLAFFAQSRKASTAWRRGNCGGHLASRGWPEKEGSCFR